MICSRVFSSGRAEEEHPGDAKRNSESTHTGSERFQENKQHTCDFSDEAQMLQCSDKTPHLRTPRGTCVDPWFFQSPRQAAHKGDPRPAKGVFSLEPTTKTKTTIGPPQRAKKATALIGSHSVARLKHCQLRLKHTKRERGKTRTRRPVTSARAPPLKTSNG